MKRDFTIPIMDIYECSKCGHQADLMEFSDTEHDGDVLGTCPKCNANCILFEISEYYQTKQEEKIMSFEANSQIEGKELNWEDIIENDGNDYITLPEGDYDFEVVDFERGRHNGSPKLPPCNKAVVHIKITDREGTVTIKHQLFLHTITEGMLCAFFTSIGQRRHGEKLQMNWNRIIGSRGRAKVYIDKWEKDGKEFTANKIKRFYDPAPPQQQPSGGFQAGRF